jgi:hypothetical protein
MDCLIQLATALCLISPSQVTLRADISSQVSGDFRYSWNGKGYGGGHIGRVQIDVPLVSYRAFTLSGFVLHQSLTDVGDRGEERIGLQLIVHPFARGGR